MSRPSIVSPPFHKLVAHKQRHKIIKRQFIILVFPQISIFSHRPKEKRENVRITNSCNGNVNFRLFIANVVVDARQRWRWACHVVISSLSPTFRLYIISFFLSNAQDRLAVPYFERFSDTEMCFANNSDDHFASKQVHTVVQPNSSELAKDRTDSFIRQCPFSACFNLCSPHSVCETPLHLYKFFFVRFVISFSYRVVGLSFLP